jgi:shikimate kinase
MESPENRALVAKSALVVWLHAPVSVCLSRIDPGTRPLLDESPGAEAAFEALFRARLSCYAEASDIAVGSDGPVELTAGTIHEEIRRVIAD